MARKKWKDKELNIKEINNKNMDFPVQKIKFLFQVKNNLFKGKIS